MNIFDKMKEKHGKYGSFAIWKQPNKKVKSNIEDLSLLNNDNIKLQYILVGLNISRKLEKNLSNFHDSYRYSNDFKLRHALDGTKLYGSYMTDIIKDFEEKISSKIKPYIKKNPNFLQKNIDLFLEEVNDLEIDNPILFAFGNDTYEILKENIKNYKIIKLPHYSYVKYNKEDYRKEIQKIIDDEL